MGEIIAIAIAIIIYLLFAKYINYIISLITMVCPTNILTLLLFAFAVSAVLFIIHRGKSS